MVKRFLYGGSTSSSTAGVLACQWYNAPGINSVQPGSRAYRPPYNQNSLKCWLHKKGKGTQRPQTTRLNLINIQNEHKEIAKQNMEYEYYLDKIIMGTDLASLISKVINQNEKNGVLKDKNGLYIDNNKNSIKIDLKMTTIDKTYPMEAIYNSQMINFVQNFNIIQFKCTKIEYHQNSKLVSKLVFEEQL